MGTPEIQYGFVYDEVNRLIEFTNSAHSSENVSAYSYDAKDQLTGVDYASADDETYDYDPNGNRESVTVGASTDTYMPGSNNQLYEDGTYRYTYDHEGNLTSRITLDGSGQPTLEHVDYQYDQRNRLTKALFYEEIDEESVLVRTVDYRYDPFDRLVRRALETDGNGFYDKFEYLVYDGADPVLEFVDADGQSSGLPTLGRRYLNGPAVDQVLAEEDADLEAALWHLDDHLGTTRDLVDAVGEVIEHYVFDSYGNLLAIEDENGTPISGDPSTHYLYTGLFHDPETGFYLTQTRWYDPATGRWMQQDHVPRRLLELIRIRRQRTDECDGPQRVEGREVSSHPWGRTQLL